MEKAHMFISLVKKKKKGNGYKKEHARCKTIRNPEN